jgi:type VI secretion system secreted protein Hcp
MGIGARTGKMWKAALLLGVGAAGGGAALAVASIPDSNGVIHACVEVTNGTTIPITTPGNVRLVDPAAAQTCTTNAVGGPTAELPLNWNQAGPQGVPGQTGPPGTPGTPGGTVTVTSGHTITLSGGNVITVGAPAANTLTVINPPSERASGKTLTLTLGSDTVELLGFSFGATGGGSTQSHGSGGGAGKSSVHEITITRKVDKTSLKLALFCANGKHIPNGTIVVRKAGGNHSITYQLSDVLISSYQTGGSGHDVTPTESLTLNFTKLKISYSK